MDRDDVSRRRPTPFRIECADDHGVQVLAVFGELDYATAPAFAGELRALDPDAPAVLDLCATEFMDSSGIAVMLDLARSFAGGLHLACRPQGPIARLLAMAQTHDALPYHDSRAEALDAASRSMRD